GPDEDAILRGYAEGLLLRTGQPVPLVRTTVRAMIPFHTAAQRAVGLSDGLARAAADGDTETQEWLGYVHDATIAEALAREGDRLLDDQPAPAGGLYDAAAACGGDGDELRPRRARAAFAAGDLDEAARIVEEVAAAAPLADIAAAVWAARGQMGHAHAVYAAQDASGPGAEIAAFAVGDRSAVE